MYIRGNIDQLYNNRILMTKYYLLKFQTWLVSTLYNTKFKFIFAQMKPWLKGRSKYKLVVGNIIVMILCSQTIVKVTQSYLKSSHFHAYDTFGSHFRRILRLLFLTLCTFEHFNVTTSGINFLLLLQYVMKSSWSVYGVKSQLIIIDLTIN